MRNFIFKECAISVLPLMLCSIASGAEINALVSISWRFLPELMSLWLARRTCRLQLAPYRLQAKEL